MVEDHGEAAQRAVLHEEKAKLSRAAERLARLVQDLDISDESHFDPENYDA